jgi:hypothetical protein
VHLTKEMALLVFFFLRRGKACVSRQTKVHTYCATAKIVLLKKCALGKNKTQKRWLLGPYPDSSFVQITLCLFLSFIFAVSLFRLAGNYYICAMEKFNLFKCKYLEYQYNNFSTTIIILQIKSQTVNKSVNWFKYKQKKSQE